ncbi:linker histone h1 and h5 family domain-containing protein [Ditylenchus destructor]|uniref:Linker histone h1 and h5 family domain-containing protein n=1 Tax=Ditylenchus destructor TaxID=166010 RepID=A0AAD4MKX8_9BILA|nr:linker histone h1 and h5 family domain-containing protein [Ditylenchus destructor]
MSSRRYSLKGRDGILSTEKMVAKALGDVGHRKGLSWIEIFQYMRRHFHYQIGTDKLEQVKQDVRHELKRGVILGTIEEIKGFGSWSLYRLAEKKKVSPIERIREPRKRKSSSSDDSEPSRKISSPYSLRTPAVRASHPCLSQKSTVSTISRTKEREDREVSQNATPSSGFSIPSTQFGSISSRFKTPVWKRPTHDETPAPVRPTPNPGRFATPLSVTTPAYIKYKQIGTQSAISTVSTASSRLHHRKVTVQHPPYEEMVMKILTQLGERKALSEADIFKYLVLRFKVGNDYGKIKSDLKQAIRRGVLFGSIREVKGYGQWSTYQIIEKENDLPSTTPDSNYISPPAIASLSQSILSTSSLSTPAQVAPQIRTPVWKRDSQKNDSLNVSIPSSVNTSSIWATPMPFDESFSSDSGYKADSDEMDESVKRAARLKKLKDTKHYVLL